MYCESSNSNRVLKRMEHKEFLSCVYDFDMRDFSFGESIQNTSLFVIVHTNFEFRISYSGTSSMSVMLALNHYEVSLKLEFQFTVEAVVLL